MYRGIATIGVYSYGIYLWHNSVRAPLVQFATHYPEAIRWHLLFATEYTAAILLGVLATLFIEWPFLRIRDRIFPKERMPSMTVKSLDIGQPVGTTQLTLPRMQVP